MKILIIEDNAKHAKILKKQLKKIYSYETINDEPKIIQVTGEINEAMNHNIDIVFIDFLLNENDKNDKNGADVGLEIRKEYPLATLILRTAYGEENILNFIHVGFDAYIEKDTGKIGNRIDELKKIIDLARLNSQKRIKSEFSEEELNSVRLRLDTLNRAIELGFINLPQIAGISDLLERGVSEEVILKDKEKLENILSKSGSKNRNYKKFKSLNTRNSVNTDLKIMDSFLNENGERINVMRISNTRALKFRFLLKKEPQNWTRLRHRHSTFEAFIKALDLK